MKNNKICEYGCGSEANYQLKNKKWCCSKSHNSCPNIKEKNSNGLKNAYKEGRKNCNHFNGKRGWSKGELLLNIDEIFKKGSLYTGETLKKYIDYYELKEYKCEICDNDGEWLNRILVLEIDHIDGDRTNNELINLRYLCPNCHSQTDTFRGRNINNGKKKVTDNQLILALKNENNIRQALIKVKLAPKGGNYKRAKKLLNEM